jgi:hypothetical protein
MLDLALAALWLTANALIIGYAWQANMVKAVIVFYVLYLLGIVALPSGGPQWFVLAMFVAAAIRSGRPLVTMQNQEATR